MEIIDARVHLVQYIVGTGAGGELRYSGNDMTGYTSGKRFQMLPEESSQGVMAPEDILRRMDENGVEKAVLLQGSCFGFQNLYFPQAATRYPKCFRAAASYDPFCRNKEQIRKHLFEKLGCNIVKFEVSTNSGLINNHFILPLDGGVMRTEYGYADERDLVLVIDIGKCQSENRQMNRLRNAITRRPGMKFVVYHLLAVFMRDGDKLLERLRRLALPGVWFDLTALPHDCGPDAYLYPSALRYLRHGIEVAGAHKLISGSGIPSVPEEDSCSSSIRYIIDNHGLTREEKEMITYQNTEHMYFQQTGGEYEI